MLARVMHWIKRHPRYSYLIYYLCVLLLGLGGMELALRMLVRLNPSYYMAYADARPGITLKYPYGEIKFNNDGFPDDEFDKIKTRRRVGYMGDSVCYGVGAGYGYRVSELLEETFPDWEHMNLSFGIGVSGVTEENLQKTLQTTERYDLDVVVYLMNMNDILPDAAEQTASPQYETNEWLRLRKQFDWLRGRSYLYMYVRRAIRNHYVRSGYGQTGQKSYELFPQQFQDVFAATARRIDRLAVELYKRRTQLYVMILPYEMQISAEAATVYASYGFKWDDTFLERGAQAKLVELLREPIVIDLYFAFVDTIHADVSRESNGIGEYFVYNKGDRLDWNHPNRQGHRKIAEFIARQEQVRAALGASSP